MISSILLVDDVTMFLELQKMFLKLSSVHVLTARNGEEAFDTAKRSRPGLVFMDLHMPVMDGAECCTRLKSDPELKSMPVVMITSEGKASDRELCIKAGCDGFLTKPLDRIQYLQTARKHLPEIDRRDVRVPCQAKVKFRAYGVSLSGDVVNIGANGIYIATDYQMLLGTMLDVVFGLPGLNAQPIQARGKVAWLNSAPKPLNPALPVGFGVEFAAITDDSRKALDLFLKGGKPGR